MDILAEILTRYPDVDAFSFDGLHDSGYCYCQSCRDNYRKDTGQEIPAVDMNDLAFRRYLLWEDRRLESLIERMQTRLKGHQAECRARDMDDECGTVRAFYGYSA